MAALPVPQMNQDDEIDEEMVPVPPQECLKDKLYKVSIMRDFNGVPVTGKVLEIEVGKETNERMYFIEYSDGEAEHLSAEEVEKYFHEPAHPNDLVLPGNDMDTQIPLAQHRAETSKATSPKEKAKKEKVKKSAAKETKGKKVEAETNEPA